jgi:predicted dehydrogenase
MDRVLKYGMVGGGEGSFIGDVHRKAIAMDGVCEIVAGNFSRDTVKAQRTGKKLGIQSDRIYQSFEEMAEVESNREDGIDFVVIVTPNKSHYDIAKAFLQKGIHIACDKPLTLEISESEDLARIAKEKDLLFCVTYTNTGCPMVKHAREMVKHGDLGDIIMVMAEYPQDWLINNVSSLGAAQLWRTDPSECNSACVADIGCHIENTVSYITGLKIKSLLANLNKIGEGMQLETNASIMVKYDNGASGMYWACQVALGNKNAIKIRVFGTKGSLEWEGEKPDDMKVSPLGNPIQTLYRGRDKLYPSAAKFSRIPGGHPEGTYEAFANIYLAFARALIKKKTGELLTDEDLDFPSVEKGVVGVKFIHSCLESNENGSVWVNFE